MTTHTSIHRIEDPKRIAAQQKYRQTVTNSWKFNLFLLLKMPVAYIAGIRLLELDERYCKTSVPFKWLSQNPFKSIYFATQAMAAELSTGAIVMMAIQGIKPPVSMLITGMEATYSKKAKEKVYFTCEGGQQVFEAVEECIQSGEGRELKLHTVGRTKDGMEVSKFTFTWSFKQRKPK